MRAWMVPVLTLLIVGVAIANSWLLRSNPFDGDSRHYIAMAEGRLAEVRQPYTSRLLDPAISGLISRTTGLSLEASFYVVNVACLAVLLSAGLILIMGRVRSLGFVLSIVLTPILLYRFREVYLPDCMHAALAAVFFLALSRGFTWFAVPLLFLMQVTREATVLLTFFLVALSAYQRKWKLAGTAVLFTVLGIGFVGHFAKQGLGNIHEANELVYLVGKVPFNFLTNVCGVRMWTNTHAKNDPQLGRMRRWFLSSCRLGLRPARCARLEFINSMRPFR